MNSDETERKSAMFEEQEGQASRANRSAASTHRQAPLYPVWMLPLEMVDKSISHHSTYFRLFFVIRHSRQDP